MKTKFSLVIALLYGIIFTVSCSMNDRSKNEFVYIDLKSKSDKSWVELQSSRTLKNPKGSSENLKVVNVAMTHLKSHGMDSNTVLAISDAILSQLSNSNTIALIERTQMDEIIQEQGFQNSGACAESECAVELGKILSVEKMLIGSVGKIENLYSLSVRIVDVETGAVDKSVNQNYTGNIEGVLNDLVPSACSELLK